MEIENRVTEGESRFSLGVAMLLIAGMAVALWLAVAEVKSRQLVTSPDDRVTKWLVVLVFLLGGCSLIGPPLLFGTARHKPWGPGRFLWFANGTAAWLLWPPIVYMRAAGRTSASMSAACFFYGTPLMALYVSLSLLAGGYFRRADTRRLRRSWQEVFGVILGLAWACTGLYLLSLFYREDLSAK